MSSPAKIRVRLGPKAKSITLKPRSLTALKLQKVPEIDTTEWVDEGVMVTKSKKAKKLQLISWSIKSNNTSVGQRRITSTHAVAEAWLWLHQCKQDAIVKTFQQTGISLCLTGEDDHKLHLRGLPVSLGIESDEEVEFVDKI